MGAKKGVVLQTIKDVN